MTIKNALFIKTILGLNLQDFKDDSTVLVLSDLSHDQNERLNVIIPLPFLNLRNANYYFSGEGTRLSNILKKFQNQQLKLEQNQLFGIL